MNADTLKRDLEALGYTIEQEAFEHSDECMRIALDDSIHLLFSTKPHIITGGISACVLLMLREHGRFDALVEMTYPDRRVAFVEKSASEVIASAKRFIYPALAQRMMWMPAQHSMEGETVVTTLDLNRRPFRTQIIN